MLAKLSRTDLVGTPIIQRFRHTLTTLRPEAPVYLRPNGKNVEVTFSKRSEAISVGEFPAEALDEFVHAFSTDPAMLDDPGPILFKTSLFESNRKFWPRASEILSRSIHKCPVFCSIAAAETKSPFLHVYDLRNPPPLGRIPEVEDILGTVRLENSEIVRNSFEPNQMYRPVSSYGLMRLSPEMTKAVAEQI